MDGDGAVIWVAGIALAVVCLAGCGFLLVIGVQPPNDKALWIVLGSWVLTATIWFGFMRWRFEGPPTSVYFLRHSANEPETDSAADAAARPVSDALVGHRYEDCPAGRPRFRHDDQQLRRRLGLAHAQLGERATGIDRNSKTSIGAGITLFKDGRLDEDRLQQHVDEWLAAGDVAPQEIFGGEARTADRLAARQENASRLTDPSARGWETR